MIGGMYDKVVIGFEFDIIVIEVGVIFIIIDEDFFFCCDCDLFGCLCDFEFGQQVDVVVQCLYVDIVCCCDEFYFGLVY